MMLKYEIKKVLNKRINRALLAAALLLMVVLAFALLMPTEKVAPAFPLLVL